MKRLFWILLAVNVCFFGAMKLTSGRGTESLASHPPVNADKMKLLDSQPASAAAAPTAGPPAPAAAAGGRANVACMEWGPFQGEDLVRARTALEGLHLPERPVQQGAEEMRGYWVFIPPLRSKADADRKVAELRNLGVTDYQIIQDGEKWRFAVSLGVFSTEEAAARQLEKLRQKGVRSARTDRRMLESDKVVLLIPGVEASAEPKLVQLKLQFPGSELKAVSCAAPPVAAAAAPTP